MNAFQLYSELEKTKQGRAAKEGEVAPMDIVVEAGPTEFGPGPIVGEFNAVGIPAKIDKGKVAIQKTTTVVNKGDPISADLGIMLSKLNINPIEIGIPQQERLKTDSYSKPIHQTGHRWIANRYYHGDLRRIQPRLQHPLVLFTDNANPTREGERRGYIVA